MQTQTMEQAVQAVTLAKAETEIRVTRRMEIGSVLMQGDVYLHRLPNDFKHGKLIKKGEMQIAVGTGSGARHVVVGDVEVYEPARLPPGVSAPMGIEAREIMGPVIKAKKPATLTHPEHAHHKFPAGLYGVTYQYDPKTMRRVAD